MADKCLAKPLVVKSLADRVVQFAILGVYTRRLNNDSATVNIPVFIEQRNISFQNDVSFVVIQNDI